PLLLQPALPPLLALAAALVTPRAMEALKPHDAAPDVLPDPAVDPAEQQALVAVPAHQQEEAAGGQDQVRRPHGEPTRQPAVARRLLAVAEHHVEENDDADRHGEPRGLAAPPVVDPEGEGEQAEHHAGHGYRELLVNLDRGQIALLLAGGGIVAE